MLISLFKALSPYVENHYCLQGVTIATTDLWLPLQLQDITAHLCVCFSLKNIAHIPVTGRVAFYPEAIDRGGKNRGGASDRGVLVNDRGSCVLTACLGLYSIAGLP